MKVCAVICELNPPHNGHQFLVENIRKVTNCDFVVAIMGGNFVQRGEPAIYEYRLRAKMAINIGFDAVIYMPLVYTLNSADDFAYNGVSIAHLLKVDYLAFGAHLDLDKLYEIENLSNQYEFRVLLKENLQNGISYASAFGKAIKDMLNIEMSSNDILALQYIASIKQQSLGIRPIIIKRELDVSATQLRQKILANDIESIKPFVNTKNFELIKKTLPFNYNKFNEFLYGNITTKSFDELRTIKGMKEGLENKIYESNATSFLEFNKLIKTKRYTQTFLNRLYLNILFNIKRDCDLKLPYLKLVAFSDDAIIKELNTKCSLPLLTTLKDKRLLSAKSLYLYDTMASKIYNISTNSKDFLFPYHKLIKY